MRNGSGTHEERLPESESESDTESEVRKKSSVVKGGAGENTTHDVQDFFELTPERMAIAKERGFTDSSWVRDQTAKFIEVNDGKRIRNPESAWLKWLVKGAELGIGIGKPFKGRMPEPEGYVHSGRSL